MFISRYSFFVKIDDSHALLINGLTGEHFLLDNQERETFERWKNQGVTSAENPTFACQLMKHYFVFSTIDEEEQLEAITLKQAKENYNTIRNKTDAATLVLSYDCNFNCPYCYEKSEAKSKSFVPLSIEQVDSIFNLYGNSLKYITLYGGEPLLFTNEKVIRYILEKKPDAMYSIITNGYNLLYFLPLFENVNLGKVMITIDGEEDFHNKTRKLRDSKQGTFSLIEKGIDVALQKGISIKIRMNITKENISSCLHYRERMKEQYHSFFKNGQLSFELQPLFQTNAKERDYLNDQLLPIPVEGATNRYDNLMSQKTSRVLQPIFSKKPFSPLFCACNAEMNTRFYDGNGLIYSCALSLGNPKGAIGSYYPKLNYRTSGYLFRNIESLPKCQICVYKFLCGGGCANAVMDQQGNCLYSNCTQIQYELAHTIPDIYRKIIGAYNI